MIKSRTLIWLLLAITAALLSTTATAEVERSPDRSARALTVAITEYPPFTAILPDGQSVGLLVEMWRAWSETTGIPVEFIASEWAQSLDNLKAGDVDIHSGLFKNDERAAWIDFSEPIHEVKTALYSRVVDGPPVSMASLKGRQVGVLKGGFQERYIHDNYPDIVTVSYSDNAALIRALLAAEVRAIHHEIASVEAELAKMSLGGVVRRGTDGSFGSFVHVGVRKGQADLLQRINDGFAEIPVKRLAEIETRWLLNPADRFYEGASGKVKFTASEEAWLTAHPIIRMAVTTFINPVDIRTASGEYTGLNADLIKLLNRKLGITIVPDFNDKWGDVVEKVMNGDVDGAFSLSRTPEREKKILFTRPYGFDSIIVVVRAGESGLRLWEDVAGKTVSVTRGMAVAEMLEQAVGVGRTVQVEDETVGLKALASGEVDAHVSFLIPYGNAQRKERVPDLRIAVQKNVEGGTLRIGVPRDRPDLHSILRKGLNAISRDELSQIRNRWLYPPQESGSESTRRLALTPEEVKWIEAHPKIRVQNETDYPPFNYAEGGQPKGFSIDYMRLLTERIGVEVEFVTGPTWSQFLDRMKTKELDVMVNIIQTPDREKYLRFTGPFVDNPPVIVTRDDDFRVKSLADLNGLTVAMPKDFFYQEIIERKYRQIKLHLVKDQAEALRVVSFGQADASIGGVAVMNHLIRANLLTNLRFAAGVDDPDLANRMRLAVRDDWPELQVILDKAIGSVTPQEIERLREAWLGGRRLQVDERIRLTDAERRWLTSHRVLRLGVDPNWPPFDFVDKTGIHRGMAADMLALIGQRLSIDFQRAEGLTWNQVLERAQARELDVVSFCNETPSRRRYLAFSKPFVAAPWVIATRPDFRLVRDLADLRGDRVAVVKGYAIQDLAQRKFPDLPLLEVNTPLAGLNKIAQGEIDAYMGNLGVIGYLIEKNGLTNVKVAANAGFPYQELRICMRSDWPELVRLVNKALDTITPQELEDIQAHWLPSRTTSTAALETEDHLIKPSILWLFGIAVVVFVVLLGLIRILVRSSNQDSLAFQLGSPRFRVLIISTLGFFTAVVVVLAWLALDHNKQKVVDNVGTNLRTILNATDDRLDLWVNERRSFLAQMGRNSELVAITKRLLEVSAAPEALITSAPLDEARQFFRRNRDQFGDIDFFIINKDGVSIGSKRDGDLGRANWIAVEKPRLIERVFNGETVYIPPVHSDLAVGEESSRDKPTMFFAAPIQSDDGIVLAVVTQRIDPSQNFSRVLQSGRIGESGESYAFDRDGLMVSQSRFDDQLRALGLIGADQESVLNIFIRDPGVLLSPTTSVRRQDGLPPTRSADRALAGETGTDLEGYRDYRGVQVMGAWTWNHNLGLGLATEIDSSEALATYNTLRLTVFGVLAVTLILSVGATLFTLALGERTSRALMRAKEELEDRVEERTQDLHDSETRIRSIIENAADGIIVIDEKGIVESFSPAAEKIFGYTAAEVLERNVSMLMPDSIGHEHDSYLRRYLDTATARIIGTSREVVGLRKDGTEFPMDLAVGETILAGERIFTGMVRDITERKEAEDKLTDAYDVISSSIQYASRIQQSYLPSANVLQSAIPEHFVLWEPRDVVGGDMYWHRPWGGGELILLGDCTGHGVPGAFMTLISSGALDQAYMEVPAGDPARLLQRMHHMIQDGLGQDKEDGDSDDGLEVGVCYLPPDRTTLMFSGARFSLFVVEGGETSEVKGDKSGLGYRGVPHDVKFTNHQVVTRPKCRYYMTSDGLIDQIGGDRKRGFGKRRFKELIVSMRDLPMVEQKDRILLALADYQSDQIRRDDVSVLGFEVGGGMAGQGKSGKPEDVFIQFDQRLSVGFDEIDEDHRKLFDLVNKFNGFMAGSDRDVIASSLEELASYTVWHFRHEERLMQTYRYPGSEAHKKEHDDLADKVADIKKGFGDGDDHVLVGVTEFLRDWLIHHIQVTDKKLAEFLRQAV